MDSVEFVVETTHEIAINAHHRLFIGVGGWVAASDF